MTSPVVGAARIEVLGDTSGTAASMEAELKAAAAKLAAEFGKVFGPSMETVMGEAGATSGEVFYKGVDGRLRTAQGKFVSAGRAAAAGYTDAVIAEMEVSSPKVAEAGAAQGRAAAAGFTEGGAAARTGRGFMAKVTEGLMGGKALTVAAVVAVGVEAAKMAGNFQSGMTRLVTAAGETQKNIGMVSQGVLQISRSTGVSAKQLADGMYMVESAGFHGKQGLEIMRASAEGAKVDMADANVVANALTTVLTDMGKKAASPVDMMSKLVATVGHGKMTMDDLAGSIHSVLPNAAAIGLSFGQVAGALATMTAQGIGAQQASQNLNHAILALANPTSAQTKTMAAFGLNASEVAKNLGTKGLSGTLDELQRAVLAHMGPAGLTMTAALNSSEIAGGKAATMFKSLPPAVQKLAQELENGTISAVQYHHGIAKLDDQQSNLGKQWLTSYNRAKGFSDILKAGSPDAMTYSAAMAKMTGGQVGLQVALHLTGENMATYRENVKGIDAAHAEAGNHVEGWAIKQKTFNQTMSQLGATVKAAMIEIGLHLLPVLTDLGNIMLNDVFPAIGFVVRVLGDIYHLIAGHDEIKVFLGVIGGVVLVMKAWELATLAYKVAAMGLYYVQILLNAALTDNPVGLAVVAIAALAAGVVYAYEHFKPFRNLVDDVGRVMRTVFVDGFNIAKRVVTDVVDFIMAHWKAFAAGLVIAITIVLGPLAVAIGLIGGIIYELVTHFSAIKAAAEAVWSAVTGWFSRMYRDLLRIVSDTWQSVTGFFSRIYNDVTGFGSRIWHDVTGFFSRIYDDVTGAVTAVWHAVQDAWNKVFDVTRSILDSVGSYIHQHWRLLLTLVTLGVGLIYVVIQDHWHQIAAVFTRLYNDVAGIVTRLWRDLVGIWDRVYADVTAAVAAVWHAVVGIWDRVYADVTGVVSRVWRDVTGFFTRIYNDVADTVSRIWRHEVDTWTRIYNDVAGFVSRIWHDVTGFFTRIYNDIADTVSRIWRNEVDTWTRIWREVTGFASRIWRDVAGFFTRMFNDVSNIAAALWHHEVDVFSRLYGDVTGYASKIWHGVAGFFGHMRDDVTSIFGQMVSAIGTAWNKIKEIVAVPVRWVVDNVYDRGIIPLMHAVGGVLHESSMQNMKEFHFAKGGVVPGSRGQGDNIPIYATAGEVVVPLPKVAEHGGPRRLMEMLGMVPRTGGAGEHFVWGGGVAGAAGRAVSGGAKAVAHAAASAVGDLAHLAQGAFAATATPIIHRLESEADSHLGKAGMGGLMSRAVHVIGDDVLRWLKGSDAKAATGGAGGGPLPTGIHLALINQALGYAGVPVTPANEAAVDLIVRMESGWNPNAINLTDSNARAGHPSQGLMQTIPTTFDEWALPGLGGITTPIANLVAGIRYAVANYGSLQNVPGVRGVNSGTGYVGYDNGGPLMPGLTHVWNGTGRVENVTTGEHGDAMEDKTNQMIALLEVIAAKDLTIDRTALNTITRVVNDNNAYRTARTR